MNTIRTHIDIEAPPRAVWEVLADTAAYPDWNPFIRSISGTISEGEQLEVSLGASGKKPMRFTPVVTRAVPNEGFSWLGHLGIKGIFDGHHHIKLSETNTGTRVDHFEEFSGVLSPLILGAVRTSTVRGFTEMNLALKESVEANSR